VLHVFTVPFKREDNWQLAKQALLEVAERHCGPYLEEARKYLKRMSDKGFDVPNVEPRVSLQVPTAGEIHLLMRIPVKADQRNFVEQAILTDVFSGYDFSVKAAAKLQ
jgi:hypothetical protein